MEVVIRYEIVGNDPEKFVCKTLCPFKKRKKTYVASAYCVRDCKKFLSIDKKSKILYCNGGKK